jgi:hypothetical protein
VDAAARSVNVLAVLKTVESLKINSNTAIRGGTVGAALVVVRHGGSQRLYQKIPSKSRPVLQQQWLCSLS